jgi:pimeloyl-ACP methyl ester carboxylesterase
VQRTNGFRGPRNPLVMAGEGRAWLEAAWLLRDPVWRGDDVPHGGGRPVLLIPGFLAGDGSLALLARWLRARGYWTSRSDMRVNADCVREAMVPVERRLEALTERTGRPAAIVGQSRGGLFAKLLAIRRPDLVSRIVALGSPNVDPLAVSPVVAGHIALVAALGRAGVPGLFDDDCLSGQCAEALAEELARPFPSEVAYTSVYSRSDGVVDWRACLDPAAEHVEVRSSHVGMSVHPDVYRILGDRLAAGAGRPRPARA